MHVVYRRRVRTISRLQQQCVSVSVDLFDNKDQQMNQPTSETETSQKKQPRPVECFLTVCAFNHPLSFITVCITVRQQVGHNCVATVSLNKLECLRVRSTCVCHQQLYRAGRGNQRKK